MKIIKQHDSTDCGAACLAMIAYYYGYKMPIQTAREITYSGKNGTTIFNLVEACEKIGLHCDAKEGSMEELLQAISTKEIQLPLIVHLKTNHFVIIERITKNKIIIIDPDHGRIKVSKIEFENQWSGYVLSFEKKEDFKKVNLNKGSYKKYIGIMNLHCKALFIILVISIMISLIGLLGTYLFQTVIDEYIHSVTADNESVHEEEFDKNPLESLVAFLNIEENANTFFATVIILYILQSMILYIRSYLIAWISKKIDIKIVTDYYIHLQKLPLSILNSRMTGDYISRFSDTAAIRNAISSVTVTLVLDGAMVIFGGWLLYEQCNFLFRYSLIMVAVYIIIIFLYRNHIFKINHTIMEDNAKVQSFFKESIDGIETIKGNNATEIVIRNFKEKFNSLVNNIFRGNLFFASEDAFIALINSVGTTSLIWIGFHEVAAGTITIGGLVTFYLLLGYFVTPVKNLVELQPIIQRAMVSVERLNDILSSKAEDEQMDKSCVLDHIDMVEYKETIFSYDGANKILDGFSLKAHKGEKIALVGKSGCGKSTAVKLLLQFYNTGSNIFINGQPIGKFSLNDIREKIAYINQETFLLSDTIYNNIVLGCSSINDDEIHAICELCGINEFAQKLPFGIDTVLEENGMNLSSGQRQRIAIARTLVRNPEVVIFDEATCNLDRESEEDIKKAIFQLKNILCLIISHKEDIIKDCDIIYIMENGRIIEKGSYFMLQSAGTNYHQLFK